MAKLDGAGKPAAKIFGKGIGNYSPLLELGFGELKDSDRGKTNLE